MIQILLQGNVLRVSGCLTMDSARRLLAETDALTPGVREIDLSGVTEVDSAAVSLLFAWQRLAQQRTTVLAFSHLPPNLVSLATLYGVLELIPQAAH